MNLPNEFRSGEARIFKLTEYFLKSRNKPGHVDQITAMEAVSNAIHYETQNVDKEIRHCIIGVSSHYPGKFIRVVMLDDFQTIHNAFFDRTAKRKLK